MARDLRLAMSDPGRALGPPGFMVLVGALFALAAGGGVNALRPAAPAVLWTALLLAVLMALESLFREDAEDGVLEQVLASGRPLWQWVLVRVLGHWLAMVAPLLLLAPVLLLMLMAEWHLALLAGALLLGSLCLCFLGSLGAALLVAAPRQGFLLPLVLLPLYVPCLLYAVAATGGDGGGLLHLAALAAFATTLSPFATATALRLALD